MRIGEEARGATSDGSALDLWRAGLGARWAAAGGGRME